MSVDWEEVGVPRDAGTKRTSKFHIERHPGQPIGLKETHLSISRTSLYKSPKLKETFQFYKSL